MVQRDGMAAGAAKQAGVSRLATPPVPITGSIQNMSTGRATSPAEPLNNPAYTPPYQAPTSYGYDLPMNTAVPDTANFGGMPPNQGIQAAPAPEVPQGPIVGGRQWYNQLSAGDQVAQDNQYLGGDSDYNAQMGEYDKALNAFIDRITKQKQLFEQDGIDATASVDANQNQTLNGLGEDFGARGMSYSGLFDQTKNQNIGRFNETKAGITKNTSRNKTEADNRQADYSAENELGRGNAKRSALNRMANRQSIIDSQ